MIQSQSCTQAWPAVQLAQERERLVSEHWHLCRRAARRFARPGLDRADLEQVAAMGLIKALDRYDPSQATPFKAFAWQLMIGELMHYVRDGERLLRAPRRVRDLERRWVAAERELWTMLGREPFEREVARLVEATAGELRDIREYRASGNVVSFDLLRGSEHRLSPRCIEVVLDKLTVDGILAALTPLERKIVESIHLEGMTVVELAKRLGYSRRHLTRLHRNAIQRLRDTRPDMSH